MKKNIRKKNFTLIELLFVIFILIILIGISWIASNSVMRASKNKQTKSELATIETALESYHMRHNEYPDPEEFTWRIWIDDQGNKHEESYPAVPQNLSDGVDQYINYKRSNITTAQGKFNRVICDPYEMGYYYEKVGDGYKLFSHGLDGPGGDEEDDVYN